MAVGRARRQVVDAIRLPAAVRDRDELTGRLRSLRRRGERMAQAGRLPVQNGAALAWRHAVLTAEAGPCRRCRRRAGPGRRSSTPFRCRRSRRPGPAAGRARPTRAGCWTAYSTSCAPAAGGAPPAARPSRLGVPCTATCARSGRGRPGGDPLHLVTMLREQGGREPARAPRSSTPGASGRPEKGAPRLRRGQGSRDASGTSRSTPRVCCPALRRRRRPGRGRGRGPAAAAGAALLLAPGRLRGQRLRPAAGPAGLLPARADP